jgi:WD40 repeat protein
MVLATTLVFAGLSTSSPAAVAPEPRIMNLGLASWGGGTGLEGGRVAFLAIEAEQGADFNGDGDTDDSVAHIWDPVTGTRNLGLAANLFTPLAGGRLAFAAWESAQGGTDLNGDGDANDSSVHVWDPSSGQTTNLRLGTSIEEIPLRGGGLAVQVSEADQGATDLNGDGDISDWVIQVWDPATGTTNLGVATVIETMAAMPDGGVAFLVSESAEDGKDRNGDGTTGDRVPAVWNPATGRVDNVARAAATRTIPLDGHRLGFLVLEDHDGGDRNGDGDSLDKVVHIWDGTTGTNQNLGLAADSGIVTFIGLDGGRLAFVASEEEQGGDDLNADGDAGDDVVHVWDPATGTKNLRLAADAPGATLYPVPGGGLTMRITESEQGGHDLNGDGDANDRVLHLWDPATGTRNLGLAYYNSTPLDGGRIAIGVTESGHDRRDLNGDGDTDDSVLHIWHPLTQTVENLGVYSTAETKLDKGRVAFFVWERFEASGTDLNGDGDTTDELAYIWGPDTGLVNLGLAGLSGNPPALPGGGTALLVMESAHHNRDLNGDGDTLDFVLHVVTLPSPPAAPGNIRALAGDGAATVSWDTPTSDGGGAITGYTVTTLPGGRTVEVAAGSTNVVVDGLANGVAYRFTVQARNPAGPGPASDPSPAVVPVSALTGGTGDPTGGSDHDHSEDRAPSGYWMVTAEGGIYAFGDAGHHGNPVVTPGAQVVDVEPTPSGKGYWTVDSAGVVSAFGDARFAGDARASALAPRERITSLSATPTGQGYWLFTDRGRVLTSGDARHLGDMAATPLNGPVLDSISTPSGLGYYMVASDGGVFSFGDAKFHGSMGDKRLNAPVQSLVPDGDGVGYWLVASDGGIFSFETPFKGSMGATPLNKPVTGMVRFGDGYLMVGGDGGIFNFSSSPFHGSLGARPPASPVTSVAAVA